MAFPPGISRLFISDSVATVMATSTFGGQTLSDNGVTCTTADDLQILIQPGPVYQYQNLSDVSHAFVIFSAGFVCQFAFMMFGLVFRQSTKIAGHYSAEEL